MSRVGGAIRYVAALALLALCMSVRAQTHEHPFGEYVLRSSVVTTHALAPESADIHDVERERDRAILNVIVYRRDDPLQMALPARVTAHATDLAGVRQEIELEEVVANDRVSYTGTFEFLPREVLDFTIRAQPVGSDETGTLQYRERLWVRRR